MKQIESAGRDQTIVYLRLLACIIITNSHLRNIYPESISFMSFGGHLGNTLFFFASGWCLTNCTKRNIIDFMKRRFFRLYTPYLILMPFLLFQPVEFYGLKGAEFWKIIFPIYPYHFVVSMLILSLLFYGSSLIKQRFKTFNYLMQSIVVFALLVVYSTIVYDGSYKYNTNFGIPMLCCFYIIMLLGGFAKTSNLKEKSLYNALGGGISFFAYLIQSRIYLIGNMQIVQLFISILFAFFSGNFILGLRNKLRFNKNISFCSELTFEIYLVQAVIIHAFESVSFPINIVFLLISIVSCACCLRACLVSFY